MVKKHLRAIFLLKTVFSLRHCVIYFFFRSSVKENTLFLLMDKMCSFYRLYDEDTFQGTYSEGVRNGWGIVTSPSNGISSLTGDRSIHKHLL